MDLYLRKQATRNSLLHRFSMLAAGRLIKVKYVNLYNAPSYEPLKHSDMDHTAFTLQIHHTCLYLVAFTRRHHRLLVVAAI